MARDLHHNIKTVRAISPQTLAATIASKIIDRNGYESLEFPVGIGSITATNATVTAAILDGDATGSLAVATAASVLGSLTMAGATSARVSGVSKLHEKRIGYIGPHRFVQLKLTPTVTAGIPVHAPALLGHPHYGPVASQ